MNILITGGLGFIGSNCIRYFINKYPDIKIKNLDAMSYGSNIHNLDDINDNSRYKFIRGNINDKKLISKLIEDVDVIVNFAAETHVDRSISNPSSFVENNIYGVFNILEAIRKSKKEIKLIQVSTDEVYGDITTGAFNEKSTLKPSSPYSASKASSDLLVLSYVRTYGINAIVTRCTNNYGPYQSPEKLIPKTIIRSILNLKVPMYGTGNNIRNWLYVEDHCNAIDILIKRGKKGEIYNISSNDELTNLEVVTEILNLLKKDTKMIEFVEDRPGHDVRYSLDSSKIRSMGWKPKTKFKEGIKITVDWYKNNRMWWEPLIKDNKNIISKTPWKEEW